MVLKVDRINSAYSKLRISGLTVSPSPSDTTLALNTLEAMMAELEARNICIGYNRQDKPDVNDYSNLPAQFYDSVDNLLAFRLAAHFGKEIPQTLALQSMASSSFLSSATAKIPSMAPSARAPIGSGNNAGMYRFTSNFYGPTTQSPVGCDTFDMIVDDIRDITEHFTDYLNDAEEISSFTLDVDDGITVVSSSNTTTTVTYQVRADGDDGEGTTALRAKLVVTTTDGRKTTRLQYFNLTEVDI